MAKVNESKESIELFTKMYLEGTPNKEIGEIFGIKANTVCYWVKKLGIKMRGSGRKNQFANPFKLQSPERDYWLGYLFADGHVQRGVLELYSVETDVIEAFDKFTGNICKIVHEDYTVNSGEVHTIYRARIFSVDISEWFMKEFNISSTKHHNLDPDIELNWDIIRGYFDGNGSAHKVRGFTLNSSSKVWINRLSDFFINELGIEPKINQYLECYKLCVWDKDELKDLIPKLYEHNTFCIQRKKNRFEPFLSNENRKQGELLEACDGNQQLSIELTIDESSETIS